MTTRAMMAVAAIGGLLTALAVTPSADALPLPKSQQASPQGLVTEVAPGGRGRGGGGFSGRSGGISRGMRGPGPGRGISRGFRGPGRGSFNRGPRGPRAHYTGPRGGRHHHNRRRFRGYGYAAPFVGYGAYYYGGYGDDCRWLRRRALATGSAYWWDRYYACIED